MPFFWQQFDQWGDRPAISRDDDTVTYRQLEHACAEFARELPAARSLVLIDCDNSLASIVALYASLRRGHAVVLSDPGNEVLKASLCSRYAPELVYERNGDGWHLRRDDRSGRGEIHEDLALLTTTSGSTGGPKCARISRDSLQANTDAIASYLPICESDTSLLLLPIFYCYGLSVLNTHLARGACLHIGGPGAESRQFASYLRAKNITSFSGVPHTFESLERNGFRRERLAHIRYLAQAGGRLRPELVRKFDEWARENGAKFFVMYGQAEATARIAYMDPSELAAHPDCIGRAIPGGHLALVDAEGQIITGSTIEGELVYTGPNVMLGYAETREDLGRGREISGLWTGDLAMRTEDGVYRITGRKRRFCKLYGRRFNLDDIEQVLRAVDPSAACTSNDDWLFIASEGASDASLVEIVRKRFGIAAATIVTRRYSRLPLLASGKIDYHALQADLEQETARRAAGQDDRPVQERLLQTFSQAFPDRPVTLEDRFSDLGGDSMNYVVVSLDLERILKRLPEGWEHMTVGELSRAAADAPPGASVAMETGIVVRAVAILAIVLQHNDLCLAGGGVILMLIAGHNFARFHLQNFLAGRMLPAFSSILKTVLLPYWAVLTYFNLVYDPTLGEPPVGLPKFLLIGNFLYQHDWLPFPSWFIQALVQLIVVHAAVLLLPGVRRWAATHGRTFLYALFAAAVLYRIIDGVWLTDLFPTRFADQRTAWQAWVFVLGMLCQTIRTEREKRLASAALLLLSLLFWSGLWSRVVALAAAGLLLIWKHRVGVPNWLVWPLQVLASASLFIYMTHLTGVVQFLPPLGPVVMTLAGLLQGVLVWQLFTRGGAWLSGMFGRSGSGTHGRASGHATRA